MKKNILVKSAILLLITSSAQAAIIQNSGVSTSFDQLINFESVALSVNEIVTTQFASEGLNIVSHAGNVYANSCGNNRSGTGNYINSYGLGCSTNRIFQDFSLVFDNNIESLTWLVGFTGGSINYSSYLNGGLVESLNNVTLTRYTNTTFTGLFNEIRVTENNNAAYTMIDNLQISFANQVPEPTSLALLGLGLAGIGFSRRKKTT